ncbi:MAG: tetratricopeptide repeat protein [Owenweeksia sp.]|nr:tetratricopeptide repeat protein [Owenweeksia sp.]
MEHLRSLRRLINVQSGNKTQLFKLGQVALNNEEYITARRIFNYIIDTGPNGSFYAEALLLGLRAEKQRLLAADATQVEQWHSLQKEYYKVLKQLKGLPEVSELTIDLADLTAFQLNEADTAAGMLKNLITTGYISKSDLARAKIQLGDILLYQGNRWDAIIYYGQAEKAFEQSPIGQEAKFKRAKAAYYVGDFEWAQGIFNALKASTSKMIANDALYYSLLINDNIALDTSTEAMELFARADLMNYQQKPDSALYILGLMEVAFIEHPIQDEVLFLKSEILIDKKRYEEAVQSLTTLLKDHQDDILADDAQYMLARLYEEKLGKVLEAQELYQNLFTEHPDSFYASEARKRYRALRGDVLN